MKLRLERVPFALTALVALSVGTFGPGVGAATAPAGVRVAQAGSPAPAASASALLAASPSSLTFDALGASQAKRFVISTSAAGLTATIVDPTIASVVLFADGTTDPSTHTFVVTPLAAGTSTITVLDAKGVTIATVPVTVAPPNPSDTAAAVVPSPGFHSNGFLYGIAAAFVAGIALLAHGGGTSVNAASAPTTPPVVTPTPVFVTPTPEVTPTPTSPTPTGVPATATPTPSPVGQTPSPTPTATITPTPTPFGQTPSPSPSPSPIATQTPIPATPTPGPLMVSPNNFSFIIGQSPNTGTFTATEAGYTGAINVVSANTADATVSPATGTGPSAQFTITAVGPGETTINVSDTKGNTAAVVVTVTQTNVVVNHRRASPVPARIATAAPGRATTRKR